MKAYLKNMGLILLLSCIAWTTQGQDQRHELEQKRQALQKEIQRINQLQESNKSKKQNVLQKAESLVQKIRTTEELIRTYNQEANILTERITTNQKRIESLRIELRNLKKDYAGMMKQAYHSRSKQSRLLFLFSSDNFLQAYKRLQYMKQYTQYRQQQGEKIKANTEEMKSLNQKLVTEKKEQERLVAENRATQQKLQKDKKLQDQLLSEINKKGSRYVNQIQAKKNEIAKIDAEINRIIRAAIATENKGKKSTSSTSFELTPEAKALAADFESNKGRLPWPLKAGSITMPFGEHPSPLAKNVTVQSNGIRIVTGENEPAYAVFKGKVLKIQAIRGANKTVLIQHGNYITVYRNLTDLFVRSGDHVETGDKLGIVGHSRDTDQPTLNFYIFKDSNYLNPSNWILRR